MNSRHRRRHSFDALPPHGQVESAREEAERLEVAHKHETARRARAEDARGDDTALLGRDEVGDR